MSGWASTLYAFVPPAKVAAFLDFAAPRLIEGINETYILNRYQYSASGSQPYEYALCDVPMYSAHLDEFLAAFAGDLVGVIYYVTTFGTNVVTHTNSVAVSVGGTLTRAGAIADACAGKSLIASPTLLQSLSTVYDADPVSNTVTSGGNNATHIIVASLDDSGIGSLRDALTRAYPRHVTFAPGLHGTISLLSDIRAEADLTLDARGSGICVAGGLIEVGDDTIIVNLRLRNGVVNYAGQNYIDCLSVNGDNIYMKNCSLTHGADSNLEILGTNVYAEECLIAQNMEQYNTKGINITQGGGNVTLYRCAVAFVGDRCPTMFSGMRVDMLNCLVVNCGTPINFQPRDSETKLNLIKNRFIKGNISGYYKEVVNAVENLSEPNNPAYVAASGLYMAGNVNTSYPNATQAEMRQLSEGVFSIEVVDTPYTALHIADLGSLIAADAAMETDVLAAAGATPRDAIDQQIIDDIANRAAVLFPDTLNYPDLTALFD